VGVGVGGDAALVLRARRALPCEPRGLASTPLRLSAVLPEAALADAERAWHAAFVKR